MKKLRRLITTVIFPERCPYCGVPVEPFMIACDQCRNEIIRGRLPIKGGAGGFRCISSFIYEGRIRRMILRMKYHDRIQYIPQIAEPLARDIRSAYGENAFDLITFVPMHPKDLRERGYNQSALLAKALGELLALPCLDTLRKVKHTKRQHHLTYAQRKTNLKGAFELIEKDRLRGRRILIVDDIITSGNTLGCCCRALNRAKPSVVCCAAIASAGDRYPDSAVI